MNEFSELLFSGARQPIDTLGEYRWIRLGGDVHRYIGHRCHLEFLDDGDGWFSVREIRFVKHSGGADPPLHAPSDMNLKLAKTLTTMPPATEEDVLAQVSIAAMQDVRYITTLTELGVEYSGYTHALEKAAQQWPEIIANPPETFPVLVMCDGSPEDEHLLIRGNHRNPGVPVKRRLLEAIDGPEGMMIEQGSGRLKLADRLTAEDNPLVSRVMVNRIWQHLFGKGIVASPDNFGVLGQRPSHPELLDYLATKFRREGWSVKSMIRAIVLSRAYRMSSLPDPQAVAKDPTNRLLHHASVRRLEGEAIRDSILSLSGRIDLTMYGPAVPVYLSPFMQGRGRPGASGPLDGAGRRSIYQSVNRNFLSPFMITFDTPVPAAAVGLRSQSNVPAQALILLNSEFVQQQAMVWAEKIIAEQPDSLDVVLDRIYLAAFSRLPTAEERRLLGEYVQSEAGSASDAAAPPWRNPALVADICHVVFNQKEFLFLE